MVAYKVVALAAMEVSPKDLPLLMLDQLITKRKIG